MNVVIVGLGRMGLRHIEASNLVGLKIVGVVDSNESTLEKIKNLLHLSKDQCHYSLNTLFNKIIPDCIIISTTADSHYELVCLAAKVGVKYILVEKPMATSIEECRKMINICKMNNAKLSINHQMRFMEQYTLPKSLIETEDFGGLASMTVIGGNIGLSMNGTHYFEAFRFLANENIVSVCAWLDSTSIPNPRGDRFMDSSGSIRLKTKSGKRMYMEIGSDQGHGLEVIYAARNGLIKVSEMDGYISVNFRKEEWRSLPTTRYGMPSNQWSKEIPQAEVVSSTARVLNALINKSDEMVNGEYGLETIKILVAAYFSSRKNGLEVMIDENFDSGEIFPWA
jgi:predicted dehydrogenase